MILVTGATGLVGSHLALQLAENGQRFRALFRSRAGIERTRALFALHKQEALIDLMDWIEADITDIPALEKAFDGATQVYHCAALISFDPADEQRLRKTNIEGTANVVNLSLAYGVKKIVHVSSIAALGDNSGGKDFVDEETEWNPEKPHSDYAISKHGAEMEVWRGWQEGLDAVIVNPGIIIGPPLWETGSGTLWQMVRKGPRFFTYGTMGFVAATDVARNLINLMESGISGERYVLSAETLSYREMLDLAAGAAKKERPSVEAKPWMTSLGWKIDWVLANVFGQKRKLSRDDVRALHNKTRYPNDKIVAATQYEFKPISSAMKAVATLMKW
jgi:nucleoside-diphosphate-sugar epimerase